MKIKEYNRKLAVEYAHKWVHSRNPKYYDYSDIGGDCTNFISQCIYAGSHVMNYAKDMGWYYINANNKAPAWSGVEFLYKFIINNKSAGPYGKELPIQNLEIGDIIQLSFDGIRFAHSLLIVQNRPEILIATHTYDADNKSIKEYSYKKIRGIHIEGIRM